MTIAIGCSISWPGRCCRRSTSGTSARPVGQRGHQDRARAAPARRAAPGRGRRSRPPPCSRCWKWLIIMMPLRAAMPSTVRKPTSEPSEITPPLEYAARTPPTSAMGRARKVSSGQPPALERRSAAAGRCRRSAACAKSSSRFWAASQLRVLAEQLGVIAQWERHCRRAPRSTSGDHRAEVAPSHVGADVDAPRLLLALDGVRGRRHAHVGHVRQRDLRRRSACRSAGSRRRSRCCGPRECSRRARRRSGRRGRCRRPPRRPSASPRRAGRRRA